MGKDEALEVTLFFCPLGYTSVNASVNARLCVRKG